MKNRQIIDEEKTYCDNKINGLEMIKHNFTSLECETLAKALSRNYSELANRDADIDCLHLRACSDNFTKAMPVRKAEKLISIAKIKTPIGDSSFFNECKQKFAPYIEMCRATAKRKKRVRIGVGIACAAFAVLAVAGVWYGDRQGLFYGTQSITFTADGKKYTQNDAVRYNQYVEVDIPSKMGYDATGIVDAKTNKQLFDASGKSLFVVANRNLSDYDECVLEVIYEPHIYSAQVMSTKNVAAMTVSYTVESAPQDILDPPQHIEGYVFDGWYIDCQYKKQFSGDFGDYINQPLILYPHYSLAGFSLNWQLNGGSFVAEVPDAFTILSDIHLPNDDIVKKTGYVLKGWALGGKIIEYFTPTVLRDTTLTAIWEPVNYELKYETNGGEICDVKNSYTIEDDFLLAEPIRRAYSFEGWYLDRSYTKPITGIASGTMGDMTLYAKWRPIAYSISYNLCGGENNALNLDKYTAETRTQLQSPTRLGYTFAGWICGNKEITELNAAENGNIELTALWIPNEYKITVYPNNGAQAYDITVQYNGYYSIDTPARYGYTFTSYEQVTGETFACIGCYDFAYDTVVMAKYAPNQYTITYVCDSKTVHKQIATFDEACTLLIPNSDKGYKFDCWVDPNGKEYKGVVYPTKDLCLTPRYKPEEYIITLNANGGDVLSSTIKVKYNSEYTLPIPTRSGYAFSGWFSAADSSGDRMTNQRGESQSNWIYNNGATLYAVWTADYGIAMTKTSCKRDNGYNPTESGTEKDVLAHSTFDLVQLVLSGCSTNGDGSYYIPDGSTLSLSMKVLQNLGGLPTGNHLGSCNWTIHNLCNDSYTGKVFGTNIDNSRIGYGAYYVKVNYSNGCSTESSKVNLLANAKKDQVIALDLTVNTAWIITSIEVVCVYELYYDYMCNIWNWAGTKCYANWRCESTIRFR